MKLIGLTGGIGMGKSTAAAFWKRAELPVLDTDDLSRALVEPGQPTLDEIVQEFGIDLLDEAGRLRREILAARVFSNSLERNKLESILHPRIRALWRTEVSEWQKRGCEIGVIVVPLLFETGADRECDFIVCVACSEATQTMRLRRRGWSQEQIELRLRSQYSIERKVLQANYVVWNEGAHEMLNRQLAMVLARIQVPSPSPLTGF